MLFRSSDNYIKQDDVEFSPCKHVASYVSEPLRTIYEVSGLIAKPEIKAEMSGNQLEITNKNNAYTIEYPKDEELLSQLRT